jgi:catechol 2,3-dioxygenase-like lactoylglutathione lyase family enzyme
MAEKTGTVLQTVGLDHMVLHVNNLERSKQFYMDVLGLTLDMEWEGHAFLRSGHNQIGIFEARGEHKEQVRGYSEFDHIALRVDAGSEEEIRARLQASGIELLPRGEGLGWDPTPNTGVYIRDPDGHRIQLLSPDDYLHREERMKQQGGKK